MEYNYETISRVLRELAFLNPGIKIHLKDLRDIDEKGEPKSTTFFLSRWSSRVRRIPRFYEREADRLT